MSNFFSEDFKNEIKEICSGPNTRKAKNENGHVYVIEFSDGHIKIGKAFRPDRRIKEVSSSNQSLMIRSWISPKVPRPLAIEHDAHNHFYSDRAGGEFFKTDFNIAVDWIKEEIGAIYGIE